MKKEGMKMIALYGATAKVNDHITRNVGSFEAAMRGLAYLKEAGADFAVQIIPMRDNYHQFKKMVRLAESLSLRWRIGAEWLFLSASGDAKKNKEISRQRLSPKEVIEFNKPDLIFEERLAKDKGYCQAEFAQYGRLFSSCVASKRDFHIDSYGRMSFCSFVKDPKLRYNLRTGSFVECWDRFIPSLADKAQATEEYLRGCGSCVYRQDCRWCPAYAYLEQRNFSTKIEYLCAVARASRQFKEHRKRHHRRFFRVAGITIQVESDLPMGDSTFHPDFAQFKVAGPGEDTISIRHHFFIPDLRSRDLG
ncbi:MAG: hypothetical protein NT066_02085, partial [Candidatus Omnitrophica bacterium]|nr:hypothetical protein [Candidatus Omnitrophota bacterium]